MLRDGPLLRVVIRVKVESQAVNALFCRSLIDEKQREENSLYTWQSASVDVCSESSLLIRQANDNVRHVQPPCLCLSIASALHLLCQTNIAVLSDFADYIIVRTASFFSAWLLTSFIISTKWTKWLKSMAEILFSFCVRVCAFAQRTRQWDQFKTVKATDFKFDMHVSTTC